MQNIRLWLNWIVTAAVLVGGSLYISANTEHFDWASSPHLYLLVLCLPLYLAFYWINALIWKSALELVGVDARSMDLVRMGVQASLLNYVTPLQAGSHGYKAWYWAKHYSVPPLSSALIITVNSLFSLALSGGLVAVLLIFFLQSFLDHGVLIAIPLCVGLVWMSTWWVFKLLRGKLRALKISSNREVKAGAYFRHIASLNLASYLLSTAITWVTFRALGVEIEVLGCLLIALLSNLAFVIVLTPANLGIKEGLFSIFAPLLQSTSEAVVSMSLLDRLVQISILLLLFGLFQLWPSRLSADQAH